MLDRSLSTYTDESLLEWVKRLVSDEVPEQTTLDYKSTLDPGSPRTRQDTARDLAAFANAFGGEVVIGVKTVRRGDSEVPSGEAPGMPPIDGLRARLSNAIPDLVRPRLPTWESRELSVGGGNVVYLLRVPRSVVGPHMVDGRYPLRVGDRTQPMDESLVRERYRETLAGRESAESLLVSPDLRDVQREMVERSLLLRVAVLPVFPMDGVVRPEAVANRLQIVGRLRYEPAVTWFGSQSNRADEPYWRFYTSGAVVGWASAPASPFREHWISAAGRDEERPPSLHTAPFIQMLQTASEALWLSRTLVAGAAVGDLRLLVEWQDSASRPLIADFDEPHARSFDLRLVTRQAGQFVRASVDLTAPDLDAPLPVLQSLAGLLLRHVERSDGASLIRHSDSPDPLGSVELKYEGKWAQFWPPRW